MVDASWLTSFGTVAMAITLVAGCLICWMTNLFTLPGNWLAIAIIAMYVFLGPRDGVAAISVWTAAMAFGLAVIGEMLEFVAAAAGAKRAGASRRSTVYAIIGSMLGAIAGTIIGVPVPIVGSVFAAILFGGLGATAGAVYGEWTDGRPWNESFRIGHAAFWGRTIGTLGKTSVGLGIVVLVAVAVLV